MLLTLVDEGQREGDRDVSAWFLRARPISMAIRGSGHVILVESENRTMNKSPAPAESASTATAAEFRRAGHEHSTRPAKIVW
jgi:hypothetical protein